MMKLKRGESVGYFDFFKDGFTNFKRAWCLTGRLLLKMIAQLIFHNCCNHIMVVSVSPSFRRALPFAVGIWSPIRRRGCVGQENSRKKPEQAFRTEGNKNYFFLKSLDAVREVTTFSRLRSGPREHRPTRS